MKKSLSIKTGGRKLSATSSSKNVSLNKKGAGVVKATKGGTNQKMGIYGVQINSYLFSAAPYVGNCFVYCNFIITKNIYTLTVEQEDNLMCS